MRTLGWVLVYAWFSLLDFALTLYGLVFLDAAELNPLAARAFESGASVAFLVKLGAVLFVAAAAWFLSREGREPRVLRPLLSGVCVFYACLTAWGLAQVGWGGVA